MGKKGKALRSQAAAQAKRSRKIANRAKYAAWRDAGTNSKSFRQRKNSKKKGSNTKGLHLVADCGNVGCLRCNPAERKPVRILNKRQSLELIRKMYPTPKEKVEIRGGHKGAA